MAELLATTDVKRRRPMRDKPAVCAVLAPFCRCNDPAHKSPEYVSAAATLSLLGALASPD